LDYNQENTSAAHAIHMAALIHKVREGEPLTDQEQQELDKWRSQEHHEAEFQDLTDRKKVIAEVREMADYDTGEAIHVIFDQLGLKTLHGVRRIRAMNRWVPVAAIFIVVIGGIWLFVNEKKPGPKVLISGTKKDLPPGTNKAMLTLGDGSTILLDSAHNGQLAQQGNATVVNHDGHITYSKSGSDEAVVYNTISTPRGGKYQLVLRDGTRVWLNNVSSLKYPTSFEGKRRIVELSGEAYFEVAKDATKPFLVKSRDGQVEVLGTSFNVMAYEDGKVMETTLVDGLVKVVSKQNNSAIVKPGQQALVRGNVEYPIVQPADLDEALAWMHDKLFFKACGIQAIMRQVSNWYDADIAFAGGDFSNIKFSGVVSRKESLENLLDIIKSEGRVEFAIEGRKITVKLKK
jgi:transmembrane sensor